MLSYNEKQQQHFTYTRGKTHLY